MAMEIPEAYGNDGNGKLIHIGQSASIVWYRVSARVFFNYSEGKGNFHVSLIGNAGNDSASGEVSLPQGFEFLDKDIGHWVYPNSITAVRVKTKTSGVVGLANNNGYVEFSMPVKKL